MADEKKTEEKKADAPEQTPQEKWAAEHYELVEARKAAERAVFEHRQEPTQESIKAAAKAAAGNGDDEDKDKKAAAKDDEPKAGAKGPLAKGTEGYEKGAWPK